MPVTSEEFAAWKYIDADLSLSRQIKRIRFWQWRLDRAWARWQGPKKGRPKGRPLDLERAIALDERLLKLERRAILAQLDPLRGPEEAERITLIAVVPPPNEATQEADADAPEPTKPIPEGWNAEDGASGRDDDDAEPAP